MTAPRMMAAPRVGVPRPPEGGTVTAVVVLAALAPYAGIVAALDGYPSVWLLCLGLGVSVVIAGLWGRGWR